MSPTVTLCVGTGRLSPNKIPPTVRTVDPGVGGPWPPYSRARHGLFALWAVVVASRSGSVMPVQPVQPLRLASEAWAVSVALVLLLLAEAVRHPPVRRGIEG